MMTKRNILLATAVMIAILSMFIINGCGESTTTTPVVPTATPTTVPVTATPTTVPPTATPTTVPTPKDVSDQFNISADYYITPDPNTGVTTGTLIIQLFQKTTSTLSVKGFKILATDNLDFPFFGAVPYKGTFNRPPEDWTEKADLTLVEWKGNTALTKGNIYSFNTRYPNIPNMPKTLIVTLTGGTAVVNTKDAAGAEDVDVKLGNLVVNIVQRVTPPSPTSIPVTNI